MYLKITLSFFGSNEAVMGALKALKETSITEFLLDIYQSVSEHNPKYAKYRKELACLWFTLCPEHLGFNETAGEHDDPQYDDFIKTLYETGLRILTEVIYDNEAMKISKNFMHKFVRNGNIMVKISSQEEKTLNTISLTEETFNKTFNLLNSLREQLKS